MITIILPLIIIMLMVINIIVNIIIQNIYLVPTVFAQLFTKCNNTKNTGIPYKPLFSGCTTDYR